MSFGGNDGIRSVDSRRSQQILHVLGIRQEGIKSTLKLRSQANALRQYLTLGQWSKKQLRKQYYKSKQRTLELGRPSTLKHYLEEIARKNDTKHRHEYVTAQERQDLANDRHCNRMLHGLNSKHLYLASRKRKKLLESGKQKISRPQGRFASQRFRRRNLGFSRLPVAREVVLATEKERLHHYEIAEKSGQRLVTISKKQQEEALARKKKSPATRRRYPHVTSRLCDALTHSVSAKCVEESSVPNSGKPTPWVPTLGKEKQRGLEMKMYAIDVGDLETEITRSRLSLRDEERCDRKKTEKERGSQKPKKIPRRPNSAKSCRRRRQFLRHVGRPCTASECRNSSRTQRTIDGHSINEEKCGRATTAPHETPAGMSAQEATDRSLARIHFYFANRCCDLPSAFESSENMQRIRSQPDVPSAGTEKREKKALQSFSNTSHIMSRVKSFSNALRRQSLISKYSKSQDMTEEKFNELRASAREDFTDANGTIRMHDEITDPLVKFIEMISTGDNPKLSKYLSSKALDLLEHHEITAVYTIQKCSSNWSQATKTEQFKNLRFLRQYLRYKGKN